MIKFTLIKNNTITKLNMWVWEQASLYLHTLGAAELYT